MRLYANLYGSFLLWSAKLSIDKAPSNFNACLLISSLQLIQIVAAVAFSGKLGLHLLEVSKGAVIILYAVILLLNSIYAMRFARKAEADPEIDVYSLWPAATCVVSSLLFVVVVGHLLY